MKKTGMVPATAVAVAVILLLPGCDTSCSWGGCPLPALPIEQSVAGVWTGDAVTPAPADVSTSFEFAANGPFAVGTSPRTITFSDGAALTYYVTGSYAWHIPVGTSATVTFETYPSSLVFWVRTENATDVGDIQILDETGALIQSVTPTDIYQEIVVTRMAGETFIGTIDVTSTSGGDVIIDDLTIGFSSSTEAVECVVAANFELACVLTDTSSDEVRAAVQAVLQVTNISQVSGSGVLYAAPDFVLSDGSVASALTITGGTFSETNALDFTVDAAGVTTTVATTYDPIYERGSSLATVADVYTTFDIFGDPSSFSVDANGVITAQSNSGCIVNGQIAIIDGLFNAYDVSLEVSGCAGLDGSYDGLGITQDQNATNDEFPFAVFSAQTTIVGAPVK